MIDGWDKKVDYHDKFADAEKISSAWEMDKKPVKRLPSATLFIKASKRRCKLYRRIWYPHKPDKDKFAIPRSPQISYVRNLKAHLGPLKSEPHRLNVTCAIFKSYLSASQSITENHTRTQKIKLSERTMSPFALLSSLFPRSKLPRWLQPLPLSHSINIKT